MLEVSEKPAHAAGILQNKRAESRTMDEICPHLPQVIVFQPSGTGKIIRKRLCLSPLHSVS